MNRQREEERCILSYSSIPLALQSKGSPLHAGRHMPPRRRIARCQKHQPVPPSSGHCRSTCSHRSLRSCEGKRPSDAVLREMSYNAAGSTRERSGAESHKCRELGGGGCQRPMCMRKMVHEWDCWHARSEASSAIVQSSMVVLLAPSD